MTADRSRDKQRLEKLLEDAGIKLSIVATDILGASGRAMLAALIDGERDPAVLANLARARMRAKIPELRHALTGRFSDHHAFLCRVILARIDAASATIDTLTAHIEDEIAPDASRGRATGHHSRHRRATHPSDHRGDRGAT